MFALMFEVAGGIVLGVYALRALPRLVVYPLVAVSVYALRCAAIAAAVAGPVAYVGWLWRLSPFLGWTALAGTAGGACIGGTAASSPRTKCCAWRRKSAPGARRRKLGP